MQDQNTDTTSAISYLSTAELAAYLNSQRPSPPRTFIPSLISGSQTTPYVPWPSLPKPPPEGWWANRQSCSCPPCYYNTLVHRINSNSLPFPVAVPLAQLINTGLIRLNFKHQDHNNVFTAEDKEYAVAIYRDICFGIHSGQLPLQLLEILLVASRKAVLKPLEGEWDHREFELYLKRAIVRQGGDGEEESVGQSSGGARAGDDEHEKSAVVPETENENGDEGEGSVLS